VTVLEEQVVRIEPRATAFTAVCAACAAEDELTGWGGASFAGRLDLDLDHGSFLCRRGHSIRVEREPERGRRRETGTAAA
jgi:hypothetical protein